MSERVKHAGLSVAVAVSLIALTLVGSARPAGAVTCPSAVSLTAASTTLESGQSTAVTATANVGLGLRGSNSDLGPDDE